MPPPPPPSKSYLLVFDSDSEDDEGSYPRPAVPPPAAAVATNPSQPVAQDAFRIQGSETTTNSSRCRRPHVVVGDDDDDDDDDDSEDFKDTADADADDNNNGDATEAPKKLTKSQKKNRARRKKKKSKRSSSNESSPKKISFSVVSVRSYDRCFSADTVPLDGGWPLGSELYKFQDEGEIPLEDFETMRQETLRERWEQLKDSGRIEDRICKRITERPAGIPLLLETRQWDYLSGTKNPLFRPMLEEERQELFLKYSSESSDSCSDMSMTYGPPSPSSKGRSRSNSVSSMSDMSVGSSGGGGSSSTKRKSRSNSVSVQFNETYNQVYVHHVRNELEQLRNERTKSGATGCNCRKLSVYLPPKDGSGGKKAQHRRMKPSKLANELKKRGIYNPKASREDMERALHDAVEKEPCCIGNDCFCARNGIDCQADACSCWHDTHVHSKSGNKNGYLSVQEIKARCGNPMGTTVVDITAIDNFRSNLMKTVICQPVGSGVAMAI